MPHFLMFAAFLLIATFVGCVAMVSGG